MNASTVHSPLLYKYASCSLHVAAMAGTAKKQSAALHDEEVGKFLGFQILSIVRILNN
jgi:hypothetical protein